MLRKILKRFLTPILQFAAKKHASSPLEYRFQSLKMTILPSVFHPAWHLSTKCLVTFLGEKDLTGKALWELGAGSGLVSLFSAQKGAVVTATDINLTALEGLKNNALRNHLEIEVLESDIFEKMQNRFFDYIIINPPYYPQNPANDAEKAFFCGTEFQYFRRLFEGLSQYFALFSEKTEVIMILSEDCNMQKISEIAAKNGLTLQQIWEKRVWGEWNFIYQIS